jgi:hypothetical protein
MKSDPSRSAGVLAWLMTCILVALGVFWSTGTTTATAATFTYDAPAAERNGVLPTETAETISMQSRDLREESALPACDARSTATTPLVTFVATGAVPQFYRGAKPGEAPSFSLRPTEFKVDAANRHGEADAWSIGIRQPGGCVVEGFRPSPD